MKILSIIKLSSLCKKNNFFKTSKVLTAAKLVPPQTTLEPWLHVHSKYCNYFLGNENTWKYYNCLTKNVGSTRQKAVKGMLQWPGDQRPHIKREEESQPSTIHTWHFKQTPRDLVFTNPHVPERFQGIVRSKRLPPQFPIQPEIHKTEDSWLSAWLAMRMASAYLNCSNALEHWNNRAGAKQNVTLTWSLTVCLKDSRKQNKTKKTPKTPLKLWRWNLENEMFHIQFPGKWCLCTSNIHFHPLLPKKTIPSTTTGPLWPRRLWFDPFSRLPCRPGCRTTPEPYDIRFFKQHVWHGVSKWIYMI